MPDEVSKIETALQTTINEGSPFNETFRICRGDGTLRAIRAIARVHCSHEQMPGRVIGICEDITELKQVQHQLEDLNEILKQRTEEAEQASRSKSRFLTMVAHEFRTPLALLTSSTDILKRYGNRLSSAEQLQQHDHIHNAARQISLLIDSVLAYNRLESQTALINPVELNIERFLKVLAEEVRSTYSSGQTFTVLIAEECGTAMLDEIMLRRIVENLLTNAFRYTAVNGTITLQAFVEKQQLVLVVADTGIGIPEESRIHIFEAFFRCRNAEAHRGLGLGLSIVNDALSYIGGTITVESSQDKGTTMRVNIPIVDQQTGKELMSCTQS
jgi:signal transduction histidine kinase